MPQKHGFAVIMILPIVLIIFVAVAFFIFKNISKSEVTQVSEAVVSKGNCENIFPIPAPVDVNLASGILYPGQFRGDSYKPHGSFRFDNRDDNEIEVRAIMDGHILKISKYDDGYATQHLLFYQNDCGLMVMNDHLLQLSPKLQEIYNQIPLGQNGDSRTTNLSSEISVQKGELLATKVGYESFPGGYHNRNVFVDFGLYDLNKTNGIKYGDADIAKYPNIAEYGTHALCWFDYLEEPAQTIVKNLPAGGVEGEVSDYCN